jgi:hypothetical protein
VVACGKRVRVKVGKHTSGQPHPKYRMVQGG